MMTRRRSVFDPRARSFRWIGAAMLMLMGSLPVALLLAQEKLPTDAEKKTPEAATPAEETKSKTPPVTAAALPEAKEISFNFSETPWEEIARWLAEIGKKSLLVESKPSGTFTYFDNRKYTFGEALDVINSVLLTKGHILLVRNNFLILADLKEGIPPHLVERVDVKDLPKRGRTELVKVLLTLKGLVSDEAKKEFESMSSPYGKIISLPSTNQLLIVDTAQNVQQIVSLIEELEGDQGKADLRAFPLKHVSARDIERVIRDLLGLGPKEESGAAAQANAQNRGSRGGDRGGGDRGERFREMMAQMMGGQGGPPQGGPPQAGPTQANRNPNGPFVSVDERTNTLFVSATPDKLALVAQVVQRLDTPQNEEGKVEQTPRIEVYPVTAGDAEGLSQVLQSVFQASADLKVTAHPDGRSLLIYATPRDHDRIKTVLAQIKSEGLKVEVVPLRTLDATNTATLIRALLGQKADEGPRMRFSFFDRSEDETSTSGPWVEPDAERNRLVLRGTETQIRDIRNLLVKLGETGLASDGEGNVGSGRYRVIPLGGQDPKETAETVRRLWGRLAPQTPVRVEIVGQRKGKQSPPPETEKRSIDIEQTEPAPEAPKKRTEPSLPDQSKRWSIPWNNSRSPQTEPSDIQLAGYTDEAKEPTEKVEQPSEVPPAEPNFPPMEELPTKQQAAEPDESVNKSEELSDQKPADEANQEKPAEGAAGEKPVTIVVGPDNLTLFSDDPKMLDMLENLLNTVVRGEQTSQFAYYYLQVADAQETALMLDQALYGEQQRSSFFFTQEEKPNRARILPDTRANALLVVGPPAEQRKIEQLLEVIDEVERPESAATPKPYIIPVVYGNANDIAEVVRSVFAQQLFDTKRQQQPRINVPSFGGFGGFGGMGGGRGNNQNQNPNQAGKLTVGVNEQTNSLVVSAPQEIFKEVEKLVKALDESAQQQGRSARVVTLRNASPEAVEKALGNLFGVRTTAELEEERKERAKIRAEEEDEQNPRANNRRNRQRDLEDTIRNLGNQAPGGFPGGGFGGPRFFPF
jgi:type II secretory pathway component GspD/PulD (secretin)